jgi:hypothetical protein
MRTYHITITGTQPLLMHHDDIDWSDVMEKWKLHPDNKQASKAGDDRSPAFRWIGNLYRDESGRIIIPTDNIMRCLMEGATMVLVPGGKSGKTFKAQSQSGIMPRAVGWELMSAGKSIDTSQLDRLMKEKDFAKHEEAARKMGFTLFKKRAKIGQSKHVRVRPRFDQWSASGELLVVDEQITDDVLSDILEMAGKYKGLGDWRPSSKTPGTFGMFTAAVKRLS